MRGIARIVAAAPVVLAFAGCVVSPVAENCRAQVEYRRSFGADTPAGEVSAVAWSAFVEGSLAPRFPEGLTIYQARNQWRDPRGRVLGEETRVVEVLRDGDAADEANVTTVAREYREQFRQESVLVTRKPVQSCY